MVVVLLGGGIGLAANEHSQRAEERQDKRETDKAAAGARGREPPREPIEAICVHGQAPSLIWVK